MPSNKFYCGAILFFAGVLLSTLTTIVVVMVATPSNNNTTGSDGIVTINKISTRTPQITTSLLTPALQTDTAPPEEKATTTFPLKITSHTAPITTRTTPITTGKTPITTSTSLSLTVEPYTPCSKNHTTRVFAGNGTVSSPGYPMDYPPNMCRTWIFWTSPGKSVVLKLLHLEVEEFRSCAFDNVTIVVDGKRPGQTFCGGGKSAYSPRPPPSTFTGDTTVQVTMKTDNNHQDKGIKLRYSSVPDRG
ncbi:BMP1 [Branchiostoma lanceolatum]|uniref:BMP1 protein n=1 Tax=Branchiostoma lanceolatum TaxID=7740 RepID=A0A8K0ABF7_BRALA|nr:BMP1 [Branchiostoma lanceolatum]